MHITATELKARISRADISRKFALGACCLCIAFSIVLIVSAAHINPDKARSAAIASALISVYCLMIAHINWVKTVKAEAALDLVSKAAASPFNIDGGEQECPSVG